MPTLRNRVVVFGCQQLLSVNNCMRSKKGCWLKYVCPQSFNNLNSAKIKPREWGSVDERSESHDRAKRGSLPQGLDLNPAVGRMKKLVSLMENRSYNKKVEKRKLMPSAISRGNEPREKNQRNLR